MVGYDLFEHLFLEGEGLIGPEEEGEAEGHGAHYAIPCKYLLVGEMEAIPQAIEHEEDEEGQVEGSGYDTGDGGLAGWVQVRQVDYRRLHARATKGNKDDGWKVSGERGG